MISMIVFWSCLALVVYVYLAFPALVILRGLVSPRPYRHDRIEPTISMIVAAHNEAGSIAAKIENLLSLDYPRQRLQIIIASDGSDDGTETIVERYQPHGVMLLRLGRRGKATALNAAVSAATGEVLVFSDANSMFAPDAVRQLLSPLADPQVGGVAGDQRYLKSSGAASGERAYWSLDRLLKRFESRADSVVSATGAIYAIRRALFMTVPDGVTDDFVTSTRIIEQGYRLVFAENAVAWEPPAAKTSVEFGRKVRVMTRGLRGVWAVRRLLNPLSHGLYAWQLFSHKVLRRLAVFPLLGIAASTPFLWSQGGFYQAAAIAQALFYGCGLVGGVFGQTVLGRQRLFSVPWYLMVVNAAAIVAVLNLLLGRQLVLWEPQRTVGGEPPAGRVPAEFSMGQHTRLEAIQR